MKAIKLCEPLFAGNEHVYLRQCVESGFVSSVGPFVGQFETEFAKKVGRKYAIACSSGTAALHIAMLCSGVSDKSSVAVSDLTFIASLNAVAYCDASPLLVDSELNSWNLDTSLLYDHVTVCARRGRRIPDVIETVHLLGVPVDDEPLDAIRSEFGTTIVEDAAEAFGAVSPSGVPVGGFGDIACFSFNGNKIITAGGGGMIVCDDLAIAEKARHLSTQAKTDSDYYLHDQVGFNYRLTNVAAALGLAQLEQVDSFLREKARIATRYKLNLAGDDRFVFQEHPVGATPSNWLTSVRCRTPEIRESAITRLGQSQIEGRRIWTPGRDQLPFRNCEVVGGSVSRSISATSLSLPSSVFLSDEIIDRICDVLRAA